MLKILIVDEQALRTDDLCALLEQEGYRVAAVLSSADSLLDQVAAFKPDVILVDTQSPSRDTLEHLAAMDRTAPRAVVVFGTDGNRQTIQRVIEAGVSTYVVDGLEPARLKPIIDIALARFERYGHLKRELALATLKLEERQLIDQAKNLLIRHRKLDESSAYALLRKSAMSQGKTIAEIARQLVDSASLLF